MLTSYSFERVLQLCPLELQGKKKGSLFMRIKILAEKQERTGKLAHAHKSQLSGPGNVLGPYSLDLGYTLHVFRRRLL